MKKNSTLLLAVLFACTFTNCKKSDQSPYKSLFEVNIDGVLWKADSMKAIIGTPLGPSVDNFTIVGSDNKGTSFFLNKVSPVATSVDFLVSSATFYDFRTYRDFTEGNMVKVTWSTSQETATEKFVIERAYDALNFAEAGEVKAAGNSNERIDYVWKEKPPLNEAFGKLYYRIKIVDTDNKITYSVIQVINASTPALYIYGGTNYSYGFDGSINITSNNTEKRIISGTFYFSCIDDVTGSTKKMENGRFENIPY